MSAGLPNSSDVVVVASTDDTALTAVALPVGGDVIAGFTDAVATYDAIADETAGASPPTGAQRAVLS